jgi:hypothetical protein
MPLIVRHRSGRQGAALLTRWRAFLYSPEWPGGQPVTAALRWPASGFGQSRPTKTGDRSCRTTICLSIVPTGA